MIVINIVSPDCLGYSKEYTKDYNYGSYKNWRQGEGERERELRDEHTPLLERELGQEVAGIMLWASLHLYQDRSINTHTFFEGRILAVI